MGDITDITPYSEIAVTEWLKYLPKYSKLLRSEYSGLYFIKEYYNGFDSYHTLDRIASLAKNKKGIVSAYGKHLRLTKKSAERIANDLRKQAEKLESLARSYELIATAISISIDNIEEIVTMDKMIKKEIDNPF